MTFFDEDDNVIPSFLDNNARIEEVNKWLNDFPEALRLIDHNSSERKAIIHEKIRRLQAELEEIDNKRFNERQKLWKKKDQSDRELASLQEAVEREAKNAEFEKTIQLIREIVEEFVAWGMAREYQKEDIVSIIHQWVIGETGILNANEMALGKTFESIVALYIIRELFKRKHDRAPKILFLTKSSIVKTGGTYREFERWDPDCKVLSLDGSASPQDRELMATLCKSGKFVLLTNYEAVRTTKAIRTTPWDIVIMDEVHKLKGGANPSGPTDVWKSVKAVTEKSSFIMMLTGTPLVNRLEEMWAYLNIFDADAFPDCRKFTRDFVGFKQAAGVFKIEVNSDKLFKAALRGRLIRRTAAEIGLELPAVIRQDVFVEHGSNAIPISQAQAYQQMRERFFIWVDTTKKPLTANNILTQLLRLRQINVIPIAKFNVKDDDGNIIETVHLDIRESGKIDAAIERILEHNTQAIGFSSFNEPLKEMAMRLQIDGKSVAIINSETTNEMGKYEIGFQQGEIDVLLINSAMGEGLNLHRDPEKWPGGAGYGFTLDRWWNNARNDQCFKRAVRPGSTGPVFWDDFYTEGSVDEYIRLLCDEKDSQFNLVTDHSEARPREEVKAMLEKLL